MDIYIRFELVQLLGFDECQITMKGCNHVATCCVIDGLKPVLSPRPDLTLKDRTAFELMMMLAEHEGWCIGPWVPRSKVKAIDLEVALNDENSKLYFNGRSCEMCTAYLQCVLRRAELLDSGSLGAPR